MLYHIVSQNAFALIVLNKLIQRIILTVQRVVIYIHVVQHRLM